MRGWAIVMGAVSVGLLVLATPARPAVPEPGFSDTLVVGGLTQPTAIAFLPDGTLLVTEKGGALKRVTAGTATTVVTLPVCTVWETGLLGIAIDPAFATNGWIYLYRTEPLDGCGPHENEVIRVTMAPDGSIDVSTVVELLGGVNSFLAHNGGVLRLGPDGKLYVGIGDSGFMERAQNNSLLEGKVLRLERDGTVPADNPFVGQPGIRGEIFALGLRNPFRFDFDPLTGRLWLGDVGAGAMEEIDIVVAGGNYAWPHCEGTEPPGCHQPGDVPPILAYGRTGESSLGHAIIGGTFGGAALGPFAGHYLFTDLGALLIYRARPTRSRDGILGRPVPVSTDTGAVVDLVRGAAGAVYYVGYQRGEVRRLATVGAADTLVGGARLVLREGATPAKRRFAVSTRDAGLATGGIDDPTVAGGELYLRSSGSEALYPLPRAGWSRNGSTFRYSDRTLVRGPIRSVVLRPGRLLRIKGRGAGLAAFPLGADPRPIDVAVGIGVHRQCLRFGGTSRFLPGRLLVAKAAPLPAACPP